VTSAARTSLFRYDTPFLLVDDAGDNAGVAGTVTVLR
jgi:hypothetical protein